LSIINGGTLINNLVKTVKVLVFPCGSEIGLEVHRSLKYSAHVSLVGGSSVSDHGRFVFEDYHEGFPYVSDPRFVPFVRDFVSKHQIGCVYPAMDSVIAAIKSLEGSLGCPVVGSEAETTQICLSKKETIRKLEGVVATPQLYNLLHDVDRYPIFLKPDIGYGSRRVKKAETEEEARIHLQENPDCLILEHLPGPEYTVDCLSDGSGNLLYCAPRQRKRISNGISVSADNGLDGEKRFQEIARLINKSMAFKGAWFFQVKERINGDLVLMEVASRLGGSSGIRRIQGVNLALLSVYIAMGIEPAIAPNLFKVELDRASYGRYKIDIKYDAAYIDLDDTLVVREKLNLELVRFIYQCRSEGIRCVLLTRHAKNPEDTLARFRIRDVFDEIIHLTQGESKATVIKGSSPIFIDDSFSERMDVAKSLRIPVFAPDAVEGLIQF
jgi:hypothetical protein